MRKAVNIPENLDDLALWQFQKLAEASGKGQDELEIAALTHVYGLSNTETQAMKLKDRQELITRLQSVLDGKPVFAERFKMDGQEYGMHPNLSNLSVGEFADLGAVPDGIEHVHVAMSILYRPVTSKDFLLGTYEVEPYDAQLCFKRQSAMKNMPAGVALGAQLFFWSIARDCVSYIQRYSSKEWQTQRKQRSSVRSGNGQEQYTDWLKVIYAGLTKSRGVV